MKTTRLPVAILALALAACTQTPQQPSITAAAPTSGATAPPVTLTVPAPSPAPDPAIIALAQRYLRMLGYADGKSGDMTDAAFQRALLAFEKDHGLAEDGQLYSALAERLRLAVAALPKAPPAELNRNAVFLYSDGTVRSQALGLTLAPPPGLVSDAPANFLQPLRPGTQAVYHLGKRGPDGSFAPTMVVTCQAGRIAQTNLPLGLLGTITVDCRGDAPKPILWRSLYSPILGMVLRQETAAGTRDLMALRPVTSDWPSAARTGLDWALTHALETPASGVPVEWSSTGVATHFEIKAAVLISGAQAGLSGKYAPQSCRRFEMMQSGTPAIRFQGIACKNTGVWSVPGTSVHLAMPASSVGKVSPSLRSAQN